MIAFVVTGGIGDAILGQPIPGKLKEMFGQDVVLYHQEGPIGQVVSHNFEVASEMRYVNAWHSYRADEMVKIVDDPSCEMIVANTFFKTSTVSSFFMPLTDEMRLKADEMNGLYISNLAKEIGVEKEQIKDIDPYQLMMYLGHCKNYYASFNRYGIDVGYEDIKLDIPEDAIERASEWIDKYGEYVVVHDSKFGDPECVIKQWSKDSWEELVECINDRYGLPIIHFRSEDQPLFDGCISSTEVFGKQFDFYSILSFISQCKLYVGTDSWPQHSAVCHQKPKYVILKGAAAMGWDGLDKYSVNIRRGDCQVCECVSPDRTTCIFGKSGNVDCMQEIAVADVMCEIGDLNSAD